MNFDCKRVSFEEWSNHEYRKVTRKGAFAGGMSVTTIFAILYYETSFKPIAALITTPIKKIRFQSLDSP